MLFNSAAFAVFFLVVFFLYWGMEKTKQNYRNYLLLLASYFFYGWWDWRFLFLLAGLSVTNYFLALNLSKNENKKVRKALLLTGLIINIGTLGLFKYFNFFTEAFADLVSLTGYNIPAVSLHLILPVGISFYTFMSISYLVDVHKGNYKASSNILHVLLSLGFFPIIFAGPIQRPSTLLPQIEKPREFSYPRIVDGLRQILWGLFAKVTIADNMAVYANDIFSNYATYPGSTLFLGGIFYSIQIYADFSGYSNMAIGIGKLLGFNLMQNFNYPYFSRDITEFWKRWHMSLTSWFRDYVFLPISFAVSWKIKSEKVLFMKTDMYIYIVASLFTWLLTGLWHGANYTFIIWGLIHGIFLIAYRWQAKPRKTFLKKQGIGNDHPLILVPEVLVTLLIILVTWIIFRADTISEAFGYLKGMFSPSLFSIPVFTLSRKIMLICCLIALFYLWVEWRGKDSACAFSGITERLGRVPRWLSYYFLLALVFFFANSGQKFIYFQF